MASPSELLICDLGAIDYHSALALQERLRDARGQGLIADTLLLLEHSPAVYTRGRRSAPGELSFGVDWYAQRGIEIIETNRGGKVTYHGPGQLVGYPIVAVGDVVGYVRLLEQALIDALGQIGIDARARADEGPDYTGVWVENRKIASIGVHVARGVTTHGFAVNVESRALEPFGWIVACGLPEVEMTSVESELARAGRGGGSVALRTVAATATSALARRLSHVEQTVSLTELEDLIAAAPAARVGPQPDTRVGPQPDARVGPQPDARETLMGEDLDASNLLSR